MIDLHCHILPGLDDGSFDMADSLAMAAQAEQDGVVAVCATPHIRADHEVHIEEIAARVAAVQGAVAEHGLAVRILPGAEVAQTEADRLTNAQLEAVTLGGGGSWVLLEPAPGPLGSELAKLAERIAQRGIKSVIAHPERHAGADFEERLRALVEGGCLIQWTAEFVAQACPGDLVLQLAEAGLVHLLGSDAHSSLGGRPVRLAAGFERLATVCNAARMRWIVDQAPRAIVRGEALTLLP